MQIPVDRLPSLPPLIHDFYLAFDQVRGFFERDYRDPADYRAQVEEVKSRELPRKQLAALLYEQNKSYGCGPETLRNIEALTRSQTCVVVTGQQVGLFSGPLYTIYKALTAIKLAASLTQSHGAHCVPVFWMAGEDHDLDEVNHVVALDQAGRPQRIVYEERPAQPKIPVAQIFFSSEVDVCLQRLEELTPASDSKPEVLAQLRQAYQPGRTFVEAFAHWMTYLFKTYGLVFIDPCHPDLKAMGHEVFLTEISQYSPSTQSVLSASNRLRERDYAPQVQQRDGRLNLFYLDPERETVLYSQNDFVLKGTQRRFTRSEFIALLSQTPRNFSPNVLLRPLYQDAILPTVAYVGGPGEIGYFALLKEAYVRFGLPMPVIYPRKGFTLLERHIEKLLAAHSLTLPDVWRGLSGKREKIARDGIPPALKEALTAAASHLDQDMDAIKRETESFESTLGSMVDSIHNKVRHQLAHLENKVLKASKKLQSIEERRLLILENNLFPDRHLQERVFNVTPYLMKYGAVWLEKLYQALDLTHFDHQVFRLGNG